MEYTELRRLISRAGMSNKYFAQLLGINPNSVTNFKTKGVPSHIAIIATLCAAMHDSGMDFEALILEATNSRIEMGVPIKNPV